jgi:hypothetical protein
MAISLDQIVPWGRTRREYDAMFNLRPVDLADGVLDCGGGPASFVAELAATGLRAVSVDPIYRFAGSEIQARFQAVVEPLMAQVRASAGDWSWTFHRDVDDLRATRRAALGRFLADYSLRPCPPRYAVGELPSLPFGPGSFGLAVCSHLIFLYSDLLSEAFHKRALLELCRVAREVRVFPLLTLGGQRSPHVDPVRFALAEAGWGSEIVPVAYELQRGGNQMLRVVAEAG